MKKLYVCDRTKCKNCSYPVCKHTTDPAHAMIVAEDQDRQFKSIAGYLVEIIPPEQGGDDHAGKTILQ